MRFDPFIHVNQEANLINSLKGQNVILTFCLITSVCIAGYYAYKYYQEKYAYEE